MKKFLKVFVLLVVSLTLVACGSGNTEEKPGDKTSLGENSLYLITDLGTIDDKSFNQGSWEGLEQYGEEIGVTPKYIQPSEQSDSEYLNAIGRAVSEGAKIIVTPGYLFEPAVEEAQTLYPEVNFILVDGAPATYKPNTQGIKYAEQQSGFLAGYAAVKDGYTNLGFMGGLAVPAVVKFGYGFIDGANTAAEEDGVNINIRYTYLNSFNPDPAIQTQAAAWYNDGVEIIFVSAGGAGNSVMAAAEKAGKAVIGVDVDQSAESETVITSAMKNLKKSVYEACVSIGDGTFKGGQTIELDITGDMVGLPDDFSRFNTFTKENYDEIYAKLKSNQDNIASDIPTDQTVSSAKELGTSNTTIEVVE